jgi:hypothetical protein
MDIYDGADWTEIRLQLERELTEKQKKQVTDEEKESGSKRKLMQEKLIKYATRIPAFMYLTDFRENTLQDVITKLELGNRRDQTGFLPEGLTPSVEERPSVSRREAIEPGPRS